MSCSGVASCWLAHRPPPPRIPAIRRSTALFPALSSLVVCVQSRTLVCGVAHSSVASSTRSCVLRRLQSAGDGSEEATTAASRRRTLSRLAARAERNVAVVRSRSAHENGSTRWRSRQSQRGATSSLPTGGTSKQAREEWRTKKHNEAIQLTKRNKKMRPPSGLPQRKRHQSIITLMQHHQMGR